ncbi:MAG: hypothetical protein LBB25_04495 [Holosporaceae bacterium]|jgi:hypothetical protein|nr:hypothetical protein [Holosporaceae bacterium]
MEKFIKSMMVIVVMTIIHVQNSSCMALDEIGQGYLNTLAEEGWAHDGLVEKNSTNHFLSDKEQANKVSGGSHQARILVSTKRGVGKKRRGYGCDGVD